MDPWLYKHDKIDSKFGKMSSGLRQCSKILAGLNSSSISRGRTPADKKKKKLRILSFSMFLEKERVLSCFSSVKFATSVHYALFAYFWPWTNKMHLFQYYYRFFYKFFSVLIWVISRLYILIKLIFN